MHRLARHPARGTDAARYLASFDYSPPDGSLDNVLRDYRDRDAALEAYTDHDEVVFWFEHDLFDQLLLIRHLWWLGHKAPGSTTFSLVGGRDYLGMLRPDQFPPLFEGRNPITGEQVRIGTAAWRAFCDEDPAGLLPFAATDPRAADHAEYAELPFLPAAMRRHLEEFPSTANGLARSEAQILRVLSEGIRTPDEAFIEASRLEDAIFMGDLSFWTIVRRLAEGRRPLVAARVQPRAGRLPSGTLALTADGAAVLAGRADQVAMNGIDRWLGGVRLMGGSRTAPTPASGRVWRWTGLSLRPPAS